MSAAKQSSDPTADLLPARMLNEFIYCPRLFYYEHVEGIFLHSADTKRGAIEHARVDKGRGDLPRSKKKGEQPRDTDEPDSQPGSAESVDTKSAVEGDHPPLPDRAGPFTDEVIHARSVMLGSEALGVVAKLDLVEVLLENTVPSDAPPTARSVCPVEYKSGAPPAGDARDVLWDADRIQLGLQILLLRENGYRCSEGVVFYRQTRQRVRYVLTDEDEIWIRQSIGAARACAAGPIPRPLDHSPKCPRCSLAPV